MTMNKKDERVSRELLSATALTALVIAAILAVNAVIYFLTMIFGLYFSPSPPDELLLSGSTDALFADSIKEGRRVKISFCYPEDDVKNHDTGSFVYRTVNEFKERYPDFIEVEYVNLITMRDSKGRFVDFSKYETPSSTDGQPALSINRASVIFESGKNHKVVTDASSVGFASFFTLDASGNAIAYNGEEYVASMISWVLHDVHKTVYFTQNHSEQFDFSFACLLESLGYNIGIIDLRKESVPSDAALVIISNPKSDFEVAAKGSTVHTEIERLTEYINGGGRLFVSLDPYVSKLTVLEKFISEYGISVSKTLEGGRLSDIVRDPVNAITTDGFTIVADIADSELGNKINNTVSSFSDGGIIIREAGALKLSGTAKPLLTSGDSAVCENSGVVTDAEGSYTVAAYNEFKTQSGKTAKIAVVPSVYLAVADALVTNGYSNKDFLFSLFDELYDANTPPYGCNAVMYETGILENLTMSKAYTYTAIVMAVPAIIAIVGSVVIIKRKNR